MAFSKGEKNIKWNGGVSEYPNHYKMKQIRKIVLQEENYICFYCGRPAYQIHHIDNSKSNHNRENLHACCHSCNLGFAEKHQSKYTKIYGKRGYELAQQLNVSQEKVRQLHNAGKLRSMLIGNEVDAILF